MKNNLNHAWSKTSEKTKKMLGISMQKVTKVVRNKVEFILIKFSSPFRWLLKLVAQEEVNHICCDSWR